VTIPLIIDTDPGIDDVLAIMLAAASAEVQLLGVTAVAGNVGLHHTAENARRLADLLRLNVPVGRGASGALWRRDTRPATEVHGADGLGGYQLPESTRELVPAVPLLAELVDSSHEPVTLLAIGPLTNVALFMNEYPDVARRLERIVVMGGGARRHLGNITPVGEFNIWYDPDAAARVFDFGVPIRMVGLDVTHQALLFGTDWAPLAASGGPVAHMVTSMLSVYGEELYSGKGREDDGAAQHDSLAMAAVFRPGLLQYATAHVDVENVGRLTAGMTVVDLEGVTGLRTNTDVALEVDRDAFAELLVSRLVELDQRLSSSAGV
jgi:inosine-uridine nucleoside N-ribohydrolase